MIVKLKGWKENTVKEPKKKGNKYKIKKRLFRNF